MDGSMHKCMNSGSVPAWHEELKQVASQYTVDALALRFGVHVRYVIQLVRRYKLQVMPRSKPFYRTPRRNVDVAGVLAMARLGNTTSGRLAKQFGVSKKTIQRVCRDHGVTLQNKRPGAAASEKASIERVADMPPARSRDPHKSNRNEYGDYVDPDGMQEPETLPVPTDAPPGTAEKVAVLARRVANNEQLWHQLDRLDFGGLRGGVVPVDYRGGKK